MCEYCTPGFQRNTYDIESVDNSNTIVNAHLGIDSNIMTLQCVFHYYDEEKGECEPRGFIAGIFARYCPWCGRKLDEEE